MKFKNYFIILLSIITSLSILFSYTEAEAGRHKSKKSSTTQVQSSKRSGSRKAKKGKNNDKKSSKSNKRNSKSHSSVTKAPAQVPEVALNDSLTLAVNASVLKSIPSQLNPGGLRVNSVKPDMRTKRVPVGLNENFTYLPITNEFISSIKKSVVEALPDSIKNFSVSLNVGKRSLSYYITRVDKLPEKYRSNPSFVRATETYSSYSKGMKNDILALWHSHGRYYKPSSGGWMWQRPILFQTVEDMYPMSYMLPFIVPMLENAGAYVFLPRERDINRNEVIVDNDTNEGGEIYSQPYYKEMSGDKKWETGEEEGFIYDLRDFRDTENPFENGTYRQVGTVNKKSAKPSVAAWYANIPESGEYAVYVSYKTIPNSTRDAHYCINYSGGKKEFIVNQTMGGGTWIYLGTFPLEAGYSDTTPIVTLTNVSEYDGGIVTADAVKIGGGMGNISRSPRRNDIYYDPSTPDTKLDEEDAEEDDTEEVADDEAVDEEDENATNKQDEKPKTGKAPTFKISNYPRFLEGARYWLHWAGFPESVYSPFHGSDDYKDDYTSRGKWVNYLAGGSRVLPNQEGLNLPVDLAMALHTDAGKRADDSYVGTLGIYYTNDGSNYKDGTPRINSRMLTDLVMRQITNDIRHTYEPNWTRRSMWDKSYLESRVPEVPTTLIELMSHQNFADMRLGLDPEFRFTVARAIYKAMARFLGERKDREVVIQPLPVKNFYIKRESKSKNKYRLSWTATKDTLEATAMPTHYVILERTEGSMGFHKIGKTSETHFDIKVEDNKIHSFKILAANDGGVSFPSEVLSLREESGNKTPILIVNGFTRVSAPASFTDGSQAGFKGTEDFGVPYINDISFIGYQQQFSRSAGESFGKSDSNYATQVVAGNTFDFASLHGASIEAAGYGFVSVSVGAVESGEVKLSDYKIVDLILGKQKATTIGKGKSGVKHKTFSAPLRAALKEYLHKGGDLMVTGRYVAEDGAHGTSDEREFLENVLGITNGEAENNATPAFVVTKEGNNMGMNSQEYTYNNRLTDKIYIVESPGVLQESGTLNSKVLMKYSGTDKASAILSDYGKGKVICIGIPFETIKEGRQRDILMKDIINIFE
jgi:hypothetical protein